jgi:hypothetical protein
MVWESSGASVNVAGMQVPASFSSFTFRAASFSCRFAALLILLGKVRGAGYILLGWINFPGVCHGWKNKLGDDHCGGVDGRVDGGHS